MPYIARRPQHPVAVANRNGRERIGVSTGYMLGNTALTTANFDIVQDLGARWVRLDANWALAEPTTQGTFSWTEHDVQMASVAAHGLRPLVCFIGNGTPSWARGGAGTGATLATDPFNFALFIKAFMARYPWVKHYEIGNEMNLAGNMQIPNVAAYGSPASGFPTGGAWAKLMRAVYTEMKRQDPSCYVLTTSCAQADTSATDNGDLEFYSQFFADNGGHYCDGFAAHAYNTPLRPGEIYTTGSTTSFQSFSPWGRIAGFSSGQGIATGMANFIGPAPRTRATKAGAVADSQASSLKQLMALHGLEGKKVWITEMGLSTTSGGPTQAEQAEHVQRFFALSQLDWVGPMFWYAAKDLTASGIYEESFGLQTSAGVNKTAYATFKSLAQGLAP